MQRINRKYFFGAVALVALLVWLCCLPSVLFEAPYSTVVYSVEGELLSARIAKDGQWRFPMSDSLDEKYVTSVKLFEDEYFEWHPGVNPVSIFRAFRQNWKAGKTISGGSTLTMQTVRLMRGGKRRRFIEKLIEASWATRLELTHSKDEILQLYAAHAPFGGNVVGLSAAGWRYYGRPPTHFSWAEAAGLAVLPNAPGVIYPGRSPVEFLRKRNALLDKLSDRGYLDATELVLAKAEPLPGKPQPLPNFAPHFTEAVAQSEKGNGQSTLQSDLQKELNRAIDRHHERHHSNGIHNAAILVLDVKTGEPIAYVGNTTCADRGSGSEVDIVQARRSSGSLLKPFLYAALLDEGRISPQTLLPDIPTLIAGYSPKNFDLSYDGAVPAREALTRSLNVPHVRLLQEYGIEPFLLQLREAGFSSLDRGADNYGLSLILGGGEVTLWDVAQVYRRMALAAKTSGLTAPAVNRDHAQTFPYSPSASYLTLDALTDLKRPGDLAAWRSFSGSRKVAWKTGTSFGFRDAWAVGVTPEYIVAVWTGNADGEGRPGLTGASVAAPLLFEVFDDLPETTWFSAPVSEMSEVFLCNASGLQAIAACTSIDTVLLAANGQRLDVCRYHTFAYVNEVGERIDAHCGGLSSATEVSLFTLPPAWAWYYRKHHPNYGARPKWAAGCGVERADLMSLVYPRGGRQLHLPRDLSGIQKPVVFEVAHAELGRTLHWYLDEDYVGSTERHHQQPLVPSLGKHKLLVVDDLGRELGYLFTVVAG
ncbi:MAG: penicillin-binding protein 1C [Saprospiraceae bacterium]